MRHRMRVMRARVHGRLALWRHHTSLLTPMHLQHRAAAVPNCHLCKHVLQGERGGGLPRSQGCQQ